jgi:hypothetical protein
MQVAQARMEDGGARIMVQTMMVRIFLTTYHTL